MVRLKVPDHESIQTVKTLLQAEVCLTQAWLWVILTVSNFKPLAGWSAALSAGVEGVEGSRPIPSHR